MAFPEITPNHTDIWVDFWNTTFQDYLTTLGSSGNPDWPAKFFLNGRLLESEADAYKPELAGSPALAIVLPSGGTWIIGGVCYTLTEDTSITDITPNFTGWIELTVTYDAEFDTYTWDKVEHVSRPALGTGIACKVVCLSDRVDSIDISEDESDVIPVIPVLLSRIAVGGGGGGGGTYLSELLYSPADPRAANVVIEEKIAAVLATALAAVEVGGNREAPTEIDQLWNYVMGLTQGVVEVAPTTLRFLNGGLARPGIHGTASASDTELVDVGGTLPEDTEKRSYDAS